MKIYREYLKTNRFLLSPIFFSNEYFDVCTDSRIYKNEECFLALAGEKYDAADIVQSIIKLPIKYLILERNKRNIEIFENANLKYAFEFIWVSNSKQFIKEIATDHLHFWKKKSNGKTIAITGTNGKTTTKEIIYDFLKILVKDKVIATKENLNNEYGVSFTALKVDLHHEYAVFEIGTNHPGEIEDLCRIINPDAGIITNIGDGHLEFLINREGVYLEKTALYRHVSWNGNAKGPLLVDGDDEYLNRLRDLKKVKSISSQMLLINEENPHLCQLTWEGSSYILNIPNFYGEHNIKNVCMGFALISCLLPGSEKSLIDACRNIQPYKMRSQRIQKDDQFIFFDAYNANPSSMKNSLKAFVSMTKKLGRNEVLLVIGQMNELGESSEQFHIELAKFIKNLNFKNVITIGMKCAAMQSVLGKDMKFFETVSDAKSWYSATHKNYKAIFIKGSRTVYLEQLLE